MTDPEINAENRRIRNIANLKTGADGFNFSTLITLAYEQAVFDLCLSKLSEFYGYLEPIVVNMLEKVPDCIFRKKMKERLKQKSSL